MESQDKDLQDLEYKGKLENEAFDRLHTLLENELEEHRILVARIQIAAKDFEGIDFTEDIDKLLKEDI